MVGVLIIFIVNNIIWGYILLSMQNKPLPKIFSNSKNKETEDDFVEATNDNILKAFSQFKKNPPMYDEDGGIISNGEEPVE